MPYFHYHAMDASGNAQQDTLEADDLEQAQSILAQQGLLVLKIKARSQRHGSLLRPLKLSDKELGWLTRQLASLLEAQLPLEAAISAVIEQSEHATSRYVLRQILQDIRAGQRMGQALAAFPTVFPAIYRALIDAGEQTGQLDEVMVRLADYMDKRNLLRNKISNALIYPVIVSIVSVLIIIFLLSYVVPQVVSAFTQTQNELPTLTVVMIWLSDSVRKWGWLMLIFIVSLLMIWRLAMRVPSLRLSWDAKLLKTPILGAYLQGMDIARFASTLAILNSSGVPLLSALQAAQNTVRNTYLKQALHRVRLNVQEGASLAPTLRAQGCFPPLLVHLVQSGERTGRLNIMLERAAQTLANELEQRATRTTALMEPLMILFMGGFVLLIVMAVMLPIIELNQLIQ